MGTQDILIYTEAGVTTITFNRVDKKNSITEAMYTTLADTLEQAARQAEVRCVVLQGDESIFSAGNDIADFQRQVANGQRDVAQETAGAALVSSLPAGGERPAWRFLQALSTFPKPLVAAVCGPAVGIGTTMLLHCDLVYAGDNAAFSVPFVNLGLCPEAASSLLLPQMLGYHRAAQALLLGEPLLAEAALETGLVNRVVPPAQCNALAQAQARKLASKPLAALMETKRLMKATQATQVHARIQEEGVSFSHLMTGPAAREAFAAFTEKRPADFSRC